MTEKKEPKHLNLKNYPNLKKFDEYYKDEKAFSFSLNHNKKYQIEDKYQRIM